MSKYLFLILFLSPFFSIAQNYSDDQIKAAYIYKFLINIEWPNEDQLDEFKICVLGNDTDVDKYLQSLSGSKKLRDIDIKIYTVDNINDLLALSPQAVYITPDNSINIKKLYYEVLTSPVLLITDNATQLLYVMLNFTVSSDNKIAFDLNTKNIENQGLTILPKLLVLGGTELQLRELYHLKEQELQDERIRVQEMEIKLSKQQLLIDSQLVEIQKQNKLIEIRKKAIDSLQNQIYVQKSILDGQNANLEELQLNIKMQQSLLSKSIFEMKLQKDSIKLQKDLIADQQAEIDEKLSKLDELNVEISQRETKIANQKNQLNNLQGTVDNQKMYLSFLVIILALVVFIIIYIYRSLRQKKNLNDNLMQKNNEVESQSEELQQVNSELITQKNYIQQQNDYITDSILYSKRIQNAMLPAFKGLRTNFDFFLIYKPKDIVSGDFYWGEQVKVGNLDYKFIAVVDCTGHGVPGALLSIVGSRILTEIVKLNKIYEPAEILISLNEMIRRVLKQDKSDGEFSSNDGMDVSLCRIENKKDGYDFVFAGAKQSVFFYDNDKKIVQRFRGSRLSIGGKFLNKTDKFESHKIFGTTGDVLYFLTDGFIDQNDYKRRRFGTTRFIQLISRIGNLTASEQRSIFEQELTKWQGSESQRDDITLLGLRIK